MPAAPLTVAFRVGSFPKLSETFVLKQISGLIAQGLNVVVLADQHSDEAKAPSGISDIRYIQPRSAWLKALYTRLPYRLKRAVVARGERRMAQDVDIIVANFGWFGQQVYEHTQNMNNAAPILTIFHGDDMSRSLTGAARNRYKELLKSNGVFLPISDFWRQELLDLGARDEQITIYRMGVDPDEFSFHAPEDDPSRPFRMISVGRFVEKKGLEYAIRALAKAAPRLQDRRVQLDLIGDGPLAAELKALASGLGLENSVMFHGFLPHAQVAEALQKADAFMLPSIVAADRDMEGIPVSLMEAMASGLPVISTRHSGIPELIKHNENGLLADERDVDGLAEQIMALINDPEGRRRRAIAARQTIENEFNLNTLAQQLCDICLAAAGEKTS